MAIYSDQQDVINNFAARGLLCRRYEILYGADIGGERDTIAGNLSSSSSSGGGFLLERSDLESTYWKKIKRANRTYAETGESIIMIDLETVYALNAAEYGAYNAAANHIISYVRQDAPNSTLTLYSAPPRQDVADDGSLLREETQFNERLAAYDAGAYQLIDFYTIQAYQSYFLNRNYTYRARNWVSYNVNIGKSRGETWAQVWATNAYNNDTNSYVDVDVDELKDIAKYLKLNEVYNLLLFVHPSEDTNTVSDFDNIYTVMADFAEPLNPIER